MDRLWRWARAATVRDVHADLRRGRELAYTTVMTVMDNLHRKGALTRERCGRAYVYTAALSRAEHHARLMAAVLDGSSDRADRAATLLRFVEKIPADEAAELRALLEGRTGGTGCDGVGRAGLAAGAVVWDYVNRPGVSGVSCVSAPDAGG